MPRDEVQEIDPELQQLWFEARERKLGHLSSHGFDPTVDPVHLRKASAASSSAEANVWVRAIQMSL